ncbi:MAG: phosphoribosylformimino-5-aminoimidazole carboxamide ribotide isomerase [Oscillospiraceae bacterium]|nr:phosphoribosylformimino-5-aminoimidazole carboxamide ribotide isomerase [Oscillospiraceae bacterium]MBQ8978910.1 phosphoribosylformimino-5-aminoimidazole carboxamide ribotide isomerase [Oscillospiraceae bacterium]
MRFRPCIDIHKGKVKQIVGGSLDSGNCAKENFISDKDASFYAELYREKGLSGGHIIMLDRQGTREYSLDTDQAIAALKAYPGGLQVGGGITYITAPQFLSWGASHVIVTSAVFRDGRINENALDRLVGTVGKEHLVLDLSVRCREGRYYVVTDRWTKFTDTELTPEVLAYFAGKCGEYLVHAVDVEGKQNGVDENVARILSSSPIPVTYAGGIHTFDDIDILRRYGLDFTVGSALDIFGGTLPFREIAKYKG